ncbi:MAG: hypothetical protein ACRDJU_14185, partial [Actinomycetota bacterium]
MEVVPSRPPGRHDGYPSVVAIGDGSSEALDAGAAELVAAGVADATRRPTPATWPATAPGARTEGWPRCRP